jgi:hypothetical protein
MIETPGKNLSIDGTTILHATDEDLSVGTPVMSRVQARVIEREDLAVHKRGVKTRRNAAENHDAQIGPTAKSEIDGEHGHVLESTSGTGRRCRRNSGAADAFALN